MTYDEDIASYVSQTQFPQAFVPWILPARRVTDRVMVAEREIDSWDVEKPDTLHNGVKPIANVVVLGP